MFVIVVPGTSLPTLVALLQIGSIVRQSSVLASNLADKSERATSERNEEEKREELLHVDVLRGDFVRAKVEGRSEWLARMGGVKKQEKCPRYIADQSWVLHHAAEVQKYGYLHCTRTPLSFRPISSADLHNNLCSAAFQHSYTYTSQAPSRHMKLIHMQGPAISGTSSATAL